MLLPKTEGSLTLRLDLGVVGTDLWLNFAIYLLWISATALGIREDAALKESPPLQNNTPEAAWGLQIAGGKRVPPHPASLCRSQA